jgi:hypothetical protein
MHALARLSFGQRLILAVYWLAALALIPLGYFFHLLLPFDAIAWIYLFTCVALVASCISLAGFFVNLRR